MIVSLNKMLKAANILDGIPDHVEVTQDELSDILKEIHSLKHLWKKDKCPFKFGTTNSIDTGDTVRAISFPTKLVNATLFDDNITDEELANIVQLIKDDSVECTYTGVPIKVHAPENPTRTSGKEWTEQ